MSKEITNQGIVYDYVGSLPFAYTDEMELVYSCSRCRALVMADDRDNHREWHKLHSDGYDWVNIK